VRLVVLAVVVVGIVSVAAAILMVLCGVGVVPRNPYAGLRLPSLFASDAAWTAGHRAAIIPQACTAVVDVVLTVWALVMPTADDGLWLLMTMVIVLLVGTVVSGVVASRTARRVEAQ